MGFSPELVRPSLAKLHRHNCLLGLFRFGELDDALRLYYFASDATRPNLTQHILRSVNLEDQDMLARIRSWIFHRFAQQESRCLRLLIPHQLRMAAAGVFDYI